MKFSVKTPILGFEQIKNVELEKIDDFFYKLKSCEDETVFVLVNPFLLRDYDFVVPEYFKDLLVLKEGVKPLVYNVMVVTNPIEKSVINFLAPFIFNPKEGFVAQVLLDGNRYKNYGLAQSISDFLSTNKK